MTDLSPEAKALFGAARAELEPTSKARARLARRLGARLGTAALTTGTLAAAGSPSAAAGAKLALPTLAKWLSLGVLLGSGLTSGYVLLRAPTGASATRAPGPATSTEILVPRPRSEAAAMPSALEPTRTPELLPNTESSSPLRSPDARPYRAGNGATAAQPSDAAAVPSARVGEETALMRQAHSALRAGEAHRALSLLRDHALRFPGGILAEERSAELVSTLCQLGRREEAAREAQRFLHAFPSSPLAPSVRASCAFPSRATEAR